jgi:hypothetical protein
MKYSHVGNKTFPRWEQLTSCLFHGLYRLTWFSCTTVKNFIKIKKGIADNKTLSIFAE